MGQGFAAQPCGLVEQQRVAYAKTVAEAMDLKLDMDNAADREKLRRAVLDLVAGRKMQSKKGMVEILSFSFWQAFCSATLRPKNSPRLLL
jgi:hypothetical protein